MNGNARRPALLFYCQHSLGMGHLVRTLHLVAALRAHFEVVLLSGGRMPAQIRVPDGVELVELPALGMDGASGMVSLDARFDLEQATAERRQRILAAFERVRPTALIVELFPFGRKKLAGEILPLLRAARQANPRPVVLCSLRDILVSDRRDQTAHDARAVTAINEHFDAILMHSDAAFARLEESCTAFPALTRPVHYTGFVTGALPAMPPGARHPHVLVSAGGGAVGSALLETAVAAQRLCHADTGMALRIVTGPFYPEADWHRLQALAQHSPAVELIRALPGLTQELRQASASISQGGYNTTMELLYTRVPALVVPFAEGRENEQSRRALRLADLGLLRVLDANDLNAANLAREMRRLTEFKPAALALDLDGARTSARLTRDLVRARSGLEVSA